MTWESYTYNFGGLSKCTPLNKSKAAIVSIPWESSGNIKGQNMGPISIIGASRFIEFYDRELDVEPLNIGVSTIELNKFKGNTREGIIRSISTQLSKIFSKRKMIVCIGGEETISLASVFAARKEFSNIGVIYFSAKPSLFNSYQGLNWSPFTLGKRIIEKDMPLAVLGTRSYSREEFDFIKNHSKDNLYNISAKDIYLNKNKGIIKKSVNDIRKILPDMVYIIISVDVFDPSVIISQNNLEPGGLLWYDVLEFIKEIFSSFNVVGTDIMGYAPIFGGQTYPSLTLAQLIYKILGYKFFL